MKRSVYTGVLLLLSGIATFGQTVTGKQGHAYLDDIVMEGQSLLDTAKLFISKQMPTPFGGTLRCLELNVETKETYVASYDSNDQLIDGMLVVTDGDIETLRSRPDNEYVWFVPQGSAVCFLNPDTVFIVRKYNYEMKPLGDTHMRHCVTITSRYTMRTDGTFEQLEPKCEATQMEFRLDESGHELPADRQNQVLADFNGLSLKVMQLLYGPVSASETNMAEWAELGAFFYRRTNMMGVPDADFWSAYYYKQNIHKLLLQGDGHNLDWFYRHFDEKNTNDLWLIMIVGYNHPGTACLVNDKSSWIYNELSKAAKHLKDKKARDWWKKFLK